MRPSLPTAGRFAALGRLGAADSKRIPFVQQVSAAECGAACLAMVLRHHGGNARLEDLQDQIGGGRDGTDGGAILEAARSRGLRARGVKLDVGDLEYLDRASILHWEFNHFVVFDRLKGSSVEVLDPAYGRRGVPIEEFRRAFTGIAMVFEPSETFASAKAGSRRIWRYLAPILRTGGSWTRIFVTSLLIQIFALAIPLFVGAVVDRVIPRQDYELLLLLGVAFAGLVLFQILTSLIRSHLLLQLRTVADARLTLGFLDHMVDLPYLSVSP